jgi:ubiquitin carboxyl-terminal hydrolase L5
VPATNEDKANWKGWIEIESEPAVFNVMLKEFGVQGIKVQEIYSLEDYFLALLPQPVYGLVFLFQYQDTDAGQQENPCPAHVWFANQVNGTNACASIALLNIVNNVAGIELGSELRKFKEDTITLSSEQRGQHLNKFVHVKSIHNSYARMIEMLEDDLVVEENYEEEERAKAAEAKRKAAAAAKPKSRQREGAATKKSKATAAAKRAEYSNDSAFHYVAFVPIHGTLYKLDGMDSHPQDLGLCDVDTWISIVAPLLQDRMTQFAEGGIHFALMALVKDPLIERQEELAANIALLQAIEAGLDAVHTDWRAFDGEFVGELLQGSSEEYGVSDEMIASVIMSKANAERLAGAEGADALLGWRKRVGGDQRGLKIGVMEEQRAAQEDQQRADERRGDWNPVLQDLLMCLEENGQADGLAEKHARPAKSKATSRGKGRR